MRGEGKKGRKQKTKKGAQPQGSATREQRVCRSEFITYTYSNRKKTQANHHLFAFVHVKYGSMHESHTPGIVAACRQAVWPSGIVYVARWVVFRAARSPPRSSAAVGRWGRRAPAARRAPDEARRGSGKLRRKRPALLGDAYHVLCMHSNEVSVLVRVGGGGGAAGQLGWRPS